MSKKSKSKSKEKRRARKTSIKSSNKQLYAERKRLGTNSKSKRFSLNSKRRKKVHATSHPYGKCGNIGCKKCNPKYINENRPPFTNILNPLIGGRIKYQKRVGQEK